MHCAVAENCCSDNILVHEACAQYLIQRCSNAFPKRRFVAALAMVYFMPL